MNPTKSFLTSLLSAGSVLALSLSSDEELVYFENFDSTPTIVEDNNQNFGGPAPDLAVGEFAVAGNLNTYDFSNNDLRYTGSGSSSGNARARSIGSVIEISGSSIDSYEFSFEVSLFNIPNPSANDQVNVSIYEISGISATEGILIEPRTNGSVDFDPNVSTLGTALVNQVVGPQQITGFGSITIPFPVSSTGNAGDYVFFAFTSTLDDTEDVSDLLSEFGIDNVWSDSSGTCCTATTMT